MPSREEQFASHHAFSELRTLQNVIDTTRLLAEGADIEAADYHRRISHILEAVRLRLNAADPLLAPLSQLDKVGTSLAKSRQELENFRSTRSVSHLNQAGENAEAALIQTGYLPGITGPADIQALQEAAVSFRRSLGQHHRHADEQFATARAEVESFRHQVKSLAGEVHQLKTRADEAIGRVETQFSQAEADRRREYQAAIAQGQQQVSEAEQRLQRLLSDVEQRAQAILSDIEQRAIKAASNIEQRFQAAQQSRTDKFEVALDSAKESAKAALEEISEAREEQLDEYNIEWDRFRATLAAHQAEVDRLVGAVTQTGMVAGYQRVANEERSAMRVWQVVTVASIVAFVALMIWLMPDAGSALPSNGAPPFSWPVFVGRALAALGLAGLAAFASRESAKHGEKERLLRQFELEIASVGPFLSTVPKEDQDAIKKAIADRAFGRGVQPLLIADHAASTNGAFELLRMVVKDLLSKK